MSPPTSENTPYFKKRKEFTGSVEIIVFHNVLGDVCRSCMEGQTGEDVLMDIFEMRLQRSTKRYPSGYL